MSRRRVLTRLKVTCEVEQPATELPTTSEAIDPPDDILPVVIGLIDLFQHRLQIRHRFGPHFKKTRVHTLQPKPGSGHDPGVGVAVLMAAGREPSTGGRILLQPSQAAAAVSTK